MYASKPQKETQIYMENTWSDTLVKVCVVNNTLVKVCVVNSYVSTDNEVIKDFVGAESFCTFRLRVKWQLAGDQCTRDGEVIWSW